jgi:hypothetical protein
MSTSPRNLMNATEEIEVQMSVNQLKSYIYGARILAIANKEKRERRRRNMENLKGWKIVTVKQAHKKEDRSKLDPGELSQWTRNPLHVRWDLMANKK